MASNFFLSLWCFRCPNNSALNTTTPSSCRDVIALRDGTSFRFNCGTDDYNGHIVQECDQRKLIRFCPTSSLDKYFLTMCNDSSSLPSIGVDDSSDDNPLADDISYSTVSSFDLSSVNVTSNCSVHASNRVTLSNYTALLKSPEWPHSYRTTHVRNCRWKIDIPSKRKIKLFYMYLHLGRTDVSERCEDNMDSLLVEGWKNNEVVDTHHYCGRNTPFTKYYMHKLDSLSLQLIVNSTTAESTNGTGFVIGIVLVEEVWPFKNWLEQYWWIFPIMLLICVVIGNCLWKKINHSHHKHRKQRERAFNSSLNTLPTSIASQRHPSIVQQRGVIIGGGGGGGGGGGLDNLGQISDVHAMKASVTTKVSFAAEVDVCG